MIWLLFLLGLITYFIVQRVAGVTRTPVWLLWLVAMTPAFGLTAWSLIAKHQKIPPGVVWVLCIGSFSLYFYLLQKGRIAGSTLASPSPPVRPSAAANRAADPVPEPPIVKPINQEEEASLQTCFPWSIYYLQKIEYRPQAVICRGQLRSRPEVAYQTIQANIQAKFGDRFFVVFQESADAKPFFALVPNAQAALTQTRYSVPLRRPGIAACLGILTVITTTLAGMKMAGNPQPTGVAIWQIGIPYALAVMTFLGAREFGHYWTARTYKIATTLPYFIPVIPMPMLPPIGTIGAFIQLRSPIPHRQALFDLGVIGPLAGLIVAIPLLGFGLTQSQPVMSVQPASIFTFAALDPQVSLGLAVFSKLVLGSNLGANQAIHLHPIAVAGWLGVLFTAFNLLPVGQLDGGRMVHAVFGQRTGAIIGQITRFFLLLLAVIPEGGHPHLLLSACVLFFLPVTDQPALNDVTDLDNSRDWVGLGVLVCLLVIVLPAPKLVMTWLNL